MPTDTKIFRERWPSRLVATAAEERLSFSAANNRPNKKSPSDAGAKLGFVCQGGSPVTTRTVTDTHFLHNGRDSEIRLV